MDNENKGQIVLFQTEDGQTKLEVQLQGETVWLSIDQMAELFQRNKSTISRHIKNIYEDRELNQDSTVAFFATVQNEGSRTVYLPYWIGFKADGIKMNMETKRNLQMLTFGYFPR